MLTKEHKKVYVTTPTAVVKLTVGERRKRSNVQSARLAMNEDEPAGFVFITWNFLCKFTFLYEELEKKSYGYHTPPNLVSLRLCGNILFLGT